MPLVIFPDAESTLVAYLRAGLEASAADFAEDVYVSNQVPDPRTDRMVIVRRDGGPRLDVRREAARFGIRVWATDDEDATDLTQLVRALVYDSPGTGPVRRAVELAGPVTIPDESKQPLRYFTCELIIIGS